MARTGSKMINGDVPPGTNFRGRRGLFLLPLRAHDLVPSPMRDEALARIVRMMDVLRRRGGLIWWFHVMRCSRRERL